MKNRKIYYYKTYADDLVKSRKQDYKLKDGYKWIHNNTFYNLIHNLENSYWLASRFVNTNENDANVRTSKY